MKILKATAMGLFAFFFIYLLGAFIALSLDISEWTDVQRFFVALVGGMIALPAFGITMEGL